MKVEYKQDIVAKETDSHIYWHFLGLNRLLISTLYQSRKTKFYVIQFFLE